MREMESDVFQFNNRIVKFYRDDRVPNPDENRRLEVPITEKEDVELSTKYRDLWIKQGLDPTSLTLTVRVPSGMEFTLPGGPADLVVRFKGWSFKQHAGVAAYLQSCVPTEQEQQ